MTEVTQNQPPGTPTWIDLGAPNLDHAKTFYTAVFGWTYATTTEETGYYTMCLLRDRPVAGLTGHGEGPTYFWNVYLATDDAHATTKAAVAAGAELLGGPVDVPGYGLLAMLRDPVGAQFGLWQGTGMPGCALVNEPNTLVRNDLVTATPEPARAFYATVFGLTSDANADIAGHTFLRRPDGHEIGGITPDPDTAVPHWNTSFEVADADAAVAAVNANGGAADEPVAFPYGRIATATDPFGAEFVVIERAAHVRF